MVASISPTLKNMKFMKGRKEEAVPQNDRTFSYYACKKILFSFYGSSKRMCSGLSKEKSAKIFRS